MKKFVLISHVLPPFPSGQAVMLYRIFSCINERNYYLIHTRSPLLTGRNNVNDEFRLLGDHHYIAAEPVFNVPVFFVVSWIVKAINFFVKFLVRSKNILNIVRRETETCAIVVCTGDAVDILAGYCVSRICSVPFYAYIFDDYLYQFIGSERLVVKLISPFIFKHSAGIIGPNEFICEEYQRRYGVPTVLVRNPCDKTELKKEPYEKISQLKNKIKIVYTGDVYLANYGCFRNLIQAMKLLRDYPFELHIFTPRLPEKLASEGVEGEKIFIHPSLPYVEALEQQRMGDILFLPLEFESPIPEIIRTSAPGKLGEYLASGVPVLAHVPANSFVADYLGKHECGLVASENDPSKLKDCLLKLATAERFCRTIVHNARQRALQDFDPKIAAEKLIEFISVGQCEV
jgi:glycosyltransferase involved in cell wall biosynthesis